MTTATRAACITLLSLLLAPHASAQGTKGTELLRACSATVKQADGGSITAEETVQSVWCVGYVSGVMDGLAVMGWKGGATRVCLSTFTALNKRYKVTVA